jgi:hypothetical protein
LDRILYVNRFFINQAFRESLTIYNVENRTGTTPGIKTKVESNLSFLTAGQSDNLYFYCVPKNKIVWTRSDLSNVWYIGDLSLLNNYKTGTSSYYYVRQNGDDTKPINQAFFNTKAKSGALTFLG